jgi:hypothetical protein
MDWLAFPVMLQYQHASTFVVIRVVLDYKRLWHAIDRLPNRNPVSGEFVIAVLRDPDFPSCHQAADTFKRLAHAGLSASFFGVHLVTTFLTVVSIG